MAWTLKQATSKGGKARMASMTAKQRRAFAKMGVDARRKKAREAKRGGKK
jgi:hypothetical protein